MSVILSSSDNEEFKVDKEVAQRSVLIKNMLEGKEERIGLRLQLTLLIDVGDSEAPIPLPNVTAKILGKVRIRRNKEA